jgi:hypothetical protein
MAEKLMINAKRTPLQSKKRCNLSQREKKSGED